MMQITRKSIYWGVLVSGSLFVSALPAAELVELHPFSHLARVPANADLNSIHFEGIQRVHVPVGLKPTADAAYCSAAAAREPGGSMFCPAAAVQWAVGYAATYSYKAAPMSSDENGNGQYTFQVYFRYDELGPAVLKAASWPKADDTGLAEYFAIKTYREPVQSIVIDEAQSSRCAGTYLDGVWTHTDRACQDVIRYTAAAEPSAYITVQVEPSQKFRAERTFASVTSMRP